MAGEGRITVGRPRPTNNPIINGMHSEIGKPKRYFNPKAGDDSYTYGAPCARDPESAGEVMMLWSENPMPANYKGKKKDKDPKVSKDRVFGKKSATDGTCVRDLMQNRYEMEWVNQQLSLEEKRVHKREKRQALREQSPMRVRAVPSPNASYFHHSQTQKEPTAADKFVMKKFQGVPSKLAQKYGQQRHSPFQHEQSLEQPSYEEEVEREHLPRRGTTPTLPPV